jgi:hypothetical protein
MATGKDLRFGAEVRGLRGGAEGRRGARGICDGGGVCRRER